MSDAPTPRPSLTPAQCQILFEVCCCHPNGWHPSPSALEPAEELKERGLLTRRMVDVDGPKAVYYATEEFKAAAIIDAARAPMTDPGSQN